MHRLAPFVALLALMLPAVSPAASDADIQAVSSRLICYCGCSGLAVADCSCGTADAIRERIAGQLDSGLSPDQVVAAWVAERGEQILATPTRTGFNLVGWIMPFAATFIGLLTLTVVLLRRRQASLLPARPAAVSGVDRTYLDRIEDDMRSRHG